jgi:Tfp pilus assembly protein PilF
LSASTDRRQLDRFLQSGDFAGAERWIERCSDKRERLTQRLAYVRALLSAAEVASARRALETCLREEPLSIEAQLLSAAFAEEAGEPAVAEQACRRALYIDRKCALAHFHLALIQQQLGDASGAARSLRTTTDLSADKNPHEPVPYGDGLCYGRLREMVSLLIDYSLRR